MKVLSLDIGGSSVKCAVVEVNFPSHSIIQELPTRHVPSRDFLDLRHIVVDIVRDALRERPASEVVAVSTTGVVNSDGIVVRAGQFDDYAGVSWSDVLHRELGVANVTVANDGGASTWAEYLRRGRPSESHAHIVVGSGVGGGLVSRGTLFIGDHEAGGMVGHMKVHDDTSIVCSCDRTGCLETVASGPAILRDYLHGSGRGENSGVDFGHVIDAARRGDRSAHGALTRAGAYLGRGISNVMNLFDPASITVGGGVVSADGELADHSGVGPYLRSAITSARASAHPRIAHLPIIEGGAYGNCGGLIGAALMAAAPDL